MLEITPLKEEDGKERFMDLMLKGGKVIRHTALTEQNIEIVVFEEITLEEETIRRYWEYITIGVEDNIVGYECVKKRYEEWKSIKEE